MPKIVITHKVEDVEQWLKGKLERVEHFAHLGGRNVVDHVATDASNTVAVTMVASDPEAVVAAIKSPPPDVIEKMSNHGVVPPLTVHVEK